MSLGIRVGAGHISGYLTWQSQLYKIQEYVGQGNNYNRLYNELSNAGRL